MSTTEQLTALAEEVRVANEARVRAETVEGNAQHMADEARDAERHALRAYTDACKDFAGIDHLSFR